MSIIYYLFLYLFFLKIRTIEVFSTFLVNNLYYLIKLRYNSDNGFLPLKIGIYS